MIVAVRSRAPPCCSMPWPGQPEGMAWRDEPQTFALVATSANVGGEPLVITDIAALQELAGIADMDRHP